MRQFLKHVGLVDIKDKIVVKEGQIKGLLNCLESIEIAGTAL
jgi:hypothetical protein